MRRRDKHRDDREYDQTALHSSSHGRNATRDYSAHFFRWSFARRFVHRTDNVLEVGCGSDIPMVHILFSSAPNKLCSTYVGVDLNKLPACTNQNVTLFPEFNFVTQWKKLPVVDDGYDVLVALEVLEHMHARNGVRFLRACRHLLRPGGTMILSTPCYDGVHHAANHIHEYTIPELTKLLQRVGFTIERRFGTFINIRELRGHIPALDPKLEESVHVLLPKLAEYYDNDALSCFFAPLLPDQARNNLWVCTR